MGASGSGYGLDGASCSKHHNLPAAAVCTRCGDFICEDCVQVTAEGDIRCSSCVDQRRANAEPVPWEMRQELGFVQGVLQTFQGLLLRPHEFFVRIRPEGGLGEPIKFLLLCGMINLIGAMASMVAQFVSGSFMQSFEQGLNGASNPMAPLIEQFGDKIWLFGLGYMALLFILGPVIIIANAFFQAGLIHLAAKVVSADKAGFRGTFHLYAYSQGILAISGVISLMVGLIGAWHLILYTIVSMLGGLVNMVIGLYMFVLLAFGIRDVHEVSLGRAAGAIGIFFGGLFLMACGIGALVFAGLVGSMAAL